MIINREETLETLFLVGSLSFAFKASCTVPGSFVLKSVVEADALSLLWLSLLLSKSKLSF